MQNVSIINVLFDALYKSHQAKLAELKVTGGEEAGGYMCVCVWWDGEKSTDTRGIAFLIEMKNSIVGALGQVWGTQSSRTSEWPFI